jgi:hypothetical protein
MSSLMETAVPFTISLNCMTGETAGANMVGASKRFYDPPDHGFVLATYATFDGGSMWTEAPPLQLGAGWRGVSSLLAGARVTVS